MFNYQGTAYPTYEAVTLAVMSAHPELLDDQISDFVDSHVEYEESAPCEFCGVMTSDIVHHILLRHPEEQ